VGQVIEISAHRLERSPLFFDLVDSAETETTQDRDRRAPTLDVFVVR
jgi:hypothetical protein